MKSPNPAPLGVPLPAGMEMMADAHLEEPKKEPWSAYILERLAALRFFTFSALIHVFILLIVGGTVIYKRMEETPDFAPEGSLFAPDSLELAPPEQPTLAPTTAPSVTPSASTSAPPTDLSAIVSTSAVPTFSLNAAPVPQVRATSVNATAAPPPMVTGSLTKAMAGAIAKFSSGWAKPMPGGKGGPLQKREFQFNAYLAKYAGGDWSSTVRMDPKGTIVEGSLPNLLFVMSKLSKDKVSGDPQAKPLDLASEEIFEKKPPFILFTGHRDFVLTDQEIANLRNYIIVGGCLWGDSSLPGQRSRFDLAFRREMRRVIPDLDKDWKELPSNHPIYTKAYFPDVTAPPPGINYYHEPCYFIPGMVGQIGVLYTPNDYGDMYQFGIDEHGEIDLTRDENHQMVAVNEQMWWRHNVYFRNIDGKALLKTYKFGMNIAIHLMTRWEDKLPMAATMP